VQVSPDFLFWQTMVAFWVRHHPTVPSTLAMNVPPSPLHTASCGTLTSPTLARAAQNDASLWLPRERGASGLSTVRSS
jgi:hypothetical protein